MLYKTGPIGRAMVAAPTMVALPSQTGSRVAPLQCVCVGGGGNGRATEGNPTGNEATRTPGAGLANDLSILGGAPTRWGTAAAIGGELLGAPLRKKKEVRKSTFERRIIISISITIRKNEGIQGLQQRHS